jgi:hypothetical protein
MVLHLNESILENSAYIRLEWEGSGIYKNTLAYYKRCSFIEKLLWQQKFFEAGKNFLLIINFDIIRLLLFKFQ